MTILVVDDDENIRESLSCILQYNGFNVLKAKEGNEALSIMKENEISTMITDVNMPNGMDGFELIKNTNPKVKNIIVLSGYLDNQEIISRNERISAFFAKPFSLEELIKKLGELQ